MNVDIEYPLCYGDWRVKEPGIVVLMGSSFTVEFKPSRIMPYVTMDGDREVTSMCNLQDAKYCAERELADKEAMGL